MNDDIAIKVEGVYKDFVLPHERAGSVKGIFTSMFRQATSKKEIQHALKHISFEIKKGEFFGIVGRNGSGKSTLLKILAGIYQPTKGRVYTKGKLVPFIELGVGFNPELTGRDNVYLNGAILGFSEKEIDSMYKEIVDFAELERFMDQKLKNYSSGMQVRLAFSMAVRANAEILLIDEVLAVGDADFQRKCFDYFKMLKGSGTTVIFVTHDMNAVREYCDRAILIENSEIVEEASPSDIANSYSKMFIDESKEILQESKSGKHWGDKTLNYTKVKISPTKVTSDTTHIVLKCRAIANYDTENPLFGFSIKNASGVNILGTNTMLDGQNIEHLNKGDVVELEWTIPNVFNDGIHYVDSAIVYKGGIDTADWQEEAQVFRVLRPDSTPYLVSPKLNLKINFR